MLSKFLAPVGTCLVAMWSGETGGLRLPPKIEPPPAAPIPIQAPADPAATDPAQPPAAERPAREVRKHCAPVTARQLGTMFLKGPDGDIVAKVQDLVVEPCSGRVIYAAVSFGQMVGMGDVVYVVPWERIEALPGSHELQLSVSADVVKQGPRFANGHWPNFADGAYTASVEGYYAEADEAPAPDRRILLGRPIVR